MKKASLSIKRSIQEENKLLHIQDILSDWEHNQAAWELETVQTGRRLRIASHPEIAADTITIHAPSGEVELSIRLTDHGPVITAAAVELSVVAAKRLEMRSENIALVAEKHLSVESKGDRVEVVQGCASTQAESVSVTANLGNVDISANDDVSIVGERILLNR